MTGYAKNLHGHESNLLHQLLALIAEFENDIRRERQMDGIAKAKERGIRFVYQVNSQEGQGFWFR